MKNLHKIIANIPKLDEDILLGIWAHYRDGFRTFYIEGNHLYLEPNRQNVCILEAHTPGLVYKTLPIDVIIVYGER